MKTRKELYNTINNAMDYLQNKKITYAFIAKVMPIDGFTCSYDKLLECINTMKTNLPKLLGGFEYFLFPKIKGKNNYGAYICLDFYDTRIQEKHVRKALIDVWKFLSSVQISSMTNISSFQKELSKLIDTPYDLEELTFYPKDIFEFETSKDFGNNIKKYEDSSIDEYLLSVKGRTPRRIR